MNAKALQQTIKTIKSKGFTHLKIELEAELNRGYTESESDYCRFCDEGQVTCSECDGRGYIRQPITPQLRANFNSQDAIPDVIETEDLECDDCAGSGSVTCNECDGNYEDQGYGGNGWHDFACRDFILNNVSARAGNALVYNEFENDGSVDSEFSFTLPIEDASYALEFIEAFTALASEIGEGLNVEGAGMHISVMNTANPYRSSKRLPAELVRNFQREVTKLLPALYFTATHNHQTRGLYYRAPRVSTTSKYSAVFVQAGMGIIEYRLFDTCYDKPEAIFDKLEVIAKTLRYYSKSVKATVNLPKACGFNERRHIAELYDTPEQLKALNDGLKVLAGSKTPAQMKAERNFKLSQAKLLREAKIKLKKAEADYSEYKQRFDQELENSLEHFKARLPEYAYIWDRDTIERLRSTTDRQMLLEAMAHACGITSKPLTKKAYIETHMRKNYAYQVRTD